MPKSSDLLPEDVLIFFYGEDSVQKLASASCVEEQAFQSVNIAKTKGKFHYCRSAVPDIHCCQ